jgi:hypothetical protein
MFKRLGLYSVVSFLLLSAPLGMAEEAEDDEWQLLFQLDNDLFLGADKDYTSGIRFGFVNEIEPGTEIDKQLEKQLDQLIDYGQRSSFSKWRIPESDRLRFAWGFGLTQLMFTPDDYTALSAPEGERPYAGWLGLEYSLHAKSDRKVNSLTLSLGSTGSQSFAQDSQNWVHENISNSPIYQGWDSQVPTEVTLNLNFDYKQKSTRITDIDWDGVEFDGYHELGVELGNFRTAAYLGGLARVGYNLPASFSTPRVQLGSYGNELFRSASEKDQHFSVLGFIGIRATAVLYDITLDGPLFQNFDTGVEAKSLVGEFLYGVGMRYKNFELTFSQTLRTDEFYGQNNNQQFASVMLRLYSWLN